jgi:hypothetical protein
MNSISELLNSADKETLISAVEIYEQCYTQRYNDLIEIAILLNTRVNRKEMLDRIKELLAEAGS